MALAHNGIIKVSSTPLNSTESLIGPVPAGLSGVERHPRSPAVRPRPVRLDVALSARWKCAGASSSAAPQSGCGASWSSSPAVHSLVGGGLRNPFQHRQRARVEVVERRGPEGRLHQTTERVVQVLRQVAAELSRSTSSFSHRRDSSEFARPTMNGSLPGGGPCPANASFRREDKKPTARIVVLVGARTLVISPTATEL